MRPLTDRCPKPLLRVGGKPLIVWHIERLRRAGIVDIVINLAHLGEQIEALLGDGGSMGVSIRYSPEGQALETGGGIHNALPLLGEAPFLVVNADVWADLDYAELRLRKAHLAHLVLVENPPHNPAGDFALSGDMVTNAAGSRLTFSGIGMYRPQLFAGCQPGAFPLAPLLRRAADQGLVGGHRHAGRWTDVGTPQRLAALDEALSASGGER